MVINKNKSDLMTLDHGGKIPPQAVELEEAILGAIILHKSAIEKVPILKSEHFYRDDHQYIFECLLDLYNNNKPIDILTVTEKLKEKGYLEIVGGPYVIAKLTSKVASAANIEYHAAIIIDKFALREIIRVSVIAIQQAYLDDGDPSEIQSEIFSGLDKTYIQSGKEPVKVDEIYRQNIIDLDRIKLSENQISGIDTGYVKLNEMTHGWQKTDFIVIAARPSTGKTAFALNIVYNAAIKGKKCAIFSLEMSSKQLVNRLTSIMTGVDANKFRSANLDETDWGELHRTTMQLPIWVDDTHSLKMMDLKAKLRRLCRLHGIELVVIDYLQLMKGDIKGHNREAEISYISRSIKGLAKELEIPIIALAQLSRDVEKRKGNGRPMLSDLRESGSIEQDADMVAFLFNPNDDKFNMEPTINCDIAKQREGPVGEIPFKFKKKTQKFLNGDTF